MSLKHLGVIADGNRRWAKEQGLPTIEGHKKGLEVIEELVAAAGNAGIGFITFYVWSTENWGRSEGEISYIMKLAEGRILKMAEKMKKNNVRLLVLGSKEKISPKLASSIEQAERLTADCAGITACFCFNYGGEQEIADAATIAMRELAGSGDRASGDSRGAAAGDNDNSGDSNKKVTPEMIRAHLYHPEVPNVDMVVRTSGEERISGFMLWRAAYAEFLFLDKFFPEMTGGDIAEIVAEFESRSRRFGK